MKKAVAYCRFSSDNQREESITDQYRAIEKYCEDNDIKLIDLYKDEALSARTSDRPSFLQMIDDSNEKLFDFVIVHKLDRFSRSRYDSAFYKKKLKQNGVKVISVLENLDDSPESIILESLLEGMNEYYSANLSREVTKGMKENAYIAKFNGGTIPLGYDIVNQEYIINKEEASTIELIFNMYREGKSYQVIADHLNNKGIRTKAGKKFNKRSFESIIRNELYCGTYKYKIKGELIRLEDSLPAIISKDDWKDAQSMRKERKFYVKRDEEYNYILSGIIYYLDDQMTGYSGTGKSGKVYHYYRSSKHSKFFNAEKYEDIIKTLFMDVLFTDSNLNRLIDIIYNSLNKEVDNERVELINSNIKNLDKKIDNIIDAIVSGFKSDKLKNELNVLEEQKTQLEIELGKASIVNKVCKDDVKKHIYKYKNKINDDKNLKFILRQFIKKINIDINKNVSVELHNVESSYKHVLVGHRGLEPRTYRL